MWEAHGSDSIDVGWNLKEVECGSLHGSLQLCERFLNSPPMTCVREVREAALEGTGEEKELGLRIGWGGEVHKLLDESDYHICL